MDGAKACRDFATFSNEWLDMTKSPAFSTGLPSRLAGSGPEPIGDFNRVSRANGLCCDRLSDSGGPAAGSLDWQNLSGNFAAWVSDGRRAQVFGSFWKLGTELELSFNPGLDHYFLSPSASATASTRTTRRSVSIDQHLKLQANSHFSSHDAVTSCGALRGRRAKRGFREVTQDCRITSLDPWHGQRQ